MAQPNFGDDKHPVPCSFCDLELSQAALRDHLILCGNKTDECPRCRKFIRRAVFAYHYENNCVNPEDFDNEESTPANHPNTSLRLPSESTFKNSKQIHIERVTSSTNPSERFQSDFSVEKRITVQCPYCHEQCELGERDIHQKNCLKNPQNIRANEHLTTHLSTNPKLDWPDHADISANIPCEFCCEPIQWARYEEHTRACLTRDSQRRRDQARPYHPLVNALMTRCRYCNDERTTGALVVHEVICELNPSKIALEQQYKALHRPPPLPDPFYQSDDSDNHDFSSYNYYFQRNLT